MPTKLDETRDELNAKRKALHEIFERYPELDMPVETAEDIRRRNDELTAIGERFDELKRLDDIRRGTVGKDQEEKARGVLDLEGAGRGGRDGHKSREFEVSIGRQFTVSDAFKGYRRGQGVGPMAHLPDADLKTLLSTTAGWAPETTRTGRFIDLATRPLAVVDVIPQTETTQNAVVYMEETTFTNAATEIAEGGTYPEATLALTERTAPVRKIAVFLPVTDEAFEDEPRARSYVDNRLGFMVRQRLDSQVLIGSGISPNLTGVLNVVGIQTQAKGADPTPDAVYKAMTLIMANAFADPDTFITHPLDWQDIRLLRTADGIYIWGSPADPGPARIWGLPVVVTTAITQNTGLVGAFGQYSELAVRRGVDIQVSNSHGTFFIEGKLAVRADLRAAFIVYRPAAFAAVTGI